VLVPEEERGLGERGVVGEILDVVAAVEEAALDAVDEADARRAGDDVLQAGLELPGIRLVVLVAWGPHRGVSHVVVLRSPIRLRLPVPYT
jgi:hypothetical protein